MKLVAFSIVIIMALPSFGQEQIHVPIAGHKFKFDFGNFAFQIYFTSDTALTMALLKDENPGPEQSVAINKTEVRPNVYMVTWQEKNGTTVTDVQDFEKGIVYANVTEPGKQFEHWEGKITPLDQQMQR